MLLVLGEPEGVEGSSLLQEPHGLWQPFRMGCGQLSSVGFSGLLLQEAGFCPGTCIPLSAARGVHTPSQYPRGETLSPQACVCRQCGPTRPGSGPSHSWC